MKNSMSKWLSDHKEMAVNACWRSFTLAMVALGSMMVAYAGETAASGSGGTTAGATTIDQVFKGMLQSFYGYVLGISTAVAVVCAMIALLTLTWRTDERDVQRSVKWLKRIGVVYVTINLLGAIVAYIDSFVAPHRYTF